MAGSTAHGEERRGERLGVEQEPRVLVVGLRWVLRDERDVVTAGNAWNVNVNFDCGDVRLELIEADSDARRLGEAVLGQVAAQCPLVVVGQLRVRREGDRREGGADGLPRAR